MAQNQDVPTGTRSVLPGALTPRSWILLCVGFLLTRCSMVLIPQSASTDLELYYECFRTAAGPDGLEGLFTGGEFPYPPLAALVMLVPGKVAGLFGPVPRQIYFTGFRLWMLVFDLGIFLLLPGLVRRAFPSAPRRVVFRRTFAYLLFSVFLPSVLLERLDLAVAFLLVLAVWLVASGYTCRGAFCLGLGVALKLTPLLAVPPLFFLTVARHPDRPLRHSLPAALSGAAGIFRS
jgi:hypothetical protein